MIRQPNNRNDEMDSLGRNAQLLPVFAVRFVFAYPMAIVVLFLKTIFSYEIRLQFRSPFVLGFRSQRFRFASDRNGEILVVHTAPHWLDYESNGAVDGEREGRGGRDMENPQSSKV